MIHFKTLNRRAMLGAGLLAAPFLTLGRASAATSTHSGAKPASLTNAAPATKAGPVMTGTSVSATSFGISPSADRDQTAALQKAIDQTAAKGLGLMLPPGIYVMGGLILRPGTRLLGAPNATVLRYSGAGLGLLADRASGIRLEHIRLDGGNLPLDRARSNALLQITDSRHLTLDGVEVISSSANGIYLRGCSGRITNTLIDGARDAGLWSLDADAVTGGLTISQSTITDCRDNGILIWRTEKGDDGTRISDISIARIGNRSGGTGQFGNGINVFRSGNVTIANARITDCAFSAIRGNASGNIQMLGNHIQRIGEVAVYAEFGFEGAMISNNVIDGAATGIAVTNFNEGGRLAVVQGNLIRNLSRRAQELVDKRGEGITVEADAVVSANVIEGAATAGIMIGWGPHMRDVVATGNLIRASTIGIGVSGDKAAGKCLLANNMISGATGGGIRTMDYAKSTGIELTASAAPKHIVMLGNVVT